jgi:hypothetical protein
MKDEHLEELSYEIDDELVKYMMKYKVSPLSLSAILLARCMRLCMEVGQLDDFKNIMASARKEESKKVYQ